MKFAEALYLRNPMVFADALLKATLDRGITWTTHPDLSASGVCDECEALAGTYDREDIPDSPHMYCNCTLWDNELQEDATDSLSMMMHATLIKYNERHDSHGRFDVGDGNVRPVALGMVKPPGGGGADPNMTQIGNKKMNDLIEYGVQPTQAIAGYNAHGPVYDDAVASIEASALKAQVTTELAARSGLSEERTSDLVMTWAASSSDTLAASCALQMAAAAQFGVAPGDYLQSRADIFSSGQYALAGSPVGAESAAVYDRTLTDATKFVAAMYSYTQDTLAAQGIKSVTVYRGLGFEAPVSAAATSFLGPPPASAAASAFAASASTGELYAAAARSAGPDTLDQNPITSWSTDAGQAVQFARSQDNGGGAYVLSAQIPASRILSTAATGIGCQDEREMTAIGGSGASFGTVKTTWISTTGSDQGMGPNSETGPKAGVDFSVGMMTPEQYAAAGGVLN